MPFISIRTESGRVATLEVDPDSDTVANVKSKLQDKEGIPPEQQELEFEGEVLQDERTLASCGVATEAMLFLRVLVQVSVQQPSGEILAVSVRPTGTVQDIKEKIEQRRGSPVAQQRLILNGATLGDGRLISGLHGNGLTLRLELRYHITLRLYTGTSFEIEVASNEPVNTLSVAAQTRGHILFHLQQLMYEEEVLERGRRIDHYGIPDGATVDVVLRNYEVMVYIKTLTGRTIVLRVSNLDTVTMVKEKIEQQEGIPVQRQRLIFLGELLNDRHRLLDYRIEHESAVHLVLRADDGFQVFVELPSGRTLVVEVQPADAIAVVKARVQSREGIPFDLQEVYFEGRELSNESSFRECGVQANDTLQVRINQERNTHLSVTQRGGETLSMWVNTDHTVATLKAAIEEKEGIPVDLQELYFARQRLNNDRTLESYHIEQDYMLHLEIVVPPTLDLTVRIQGGRTIRLQKQANQTVGAVKREILQQENIPVDDQQLFLAGAELENDKKLSACDVQNDSVLDLLTDTASLTGPPVGMKLFVKTLTGKTVVLSPNPGDTVLDLKSQIQDKEGIPPTQQCLVCAGRQLPDELTISTAGIQNQSVLHLVLRVPSHGPIQVTVEGSDGRRFEVDTNVEDTVENVKARLEEEGGVAKGDQTLLFEGTPLEDGRTLGSYDIRDGSTLQLNYPQSP